MTLATVAQDKLGACDIVLDGPSRKLGAGLADGAQNIAGLIHGNWSGEGAGGDVALSANVPILVGRVAPTGAYANVPIGTLFFEFTGDSTTTPNIKDAVLWQKTANGWERFLTSPSYQIPVLSAVKALTDADATLAIADILGGVFTQTPGAARTLTIDTAAHIVAGIPRCAIGSSVQFTVKNLAASTHAITIAAGGTTNGGVAGDLSIAASATATYMLVVTAVTSPAVSLFKI